MRVRALCGGAGYEHECLTMRNVVFTASKVYCCCSSKWRMGWREPSATFCFSHVTDTSIFCGVSPDAAAGAAEA